jgi:hypothetical protein
MKKIITLVLLSALGTGTYAQGEAIAKFFSKYAADDSFTTQVTISGKMFSLFTNMEAETPEDKEILDAISNLKGLRIIGKENTSDARNLYKEAFQIITSSKYEELMAVRDKDNDMKFYILEKNPGKISELVMLSGNGKDFMLMSLFGEIDLKQVSRIGRKMNVDGLEKLEKIDEKKKD